jgi:succinyl-CoA synthetase beta subunit
MDIKGITVARVLVAPAADNASEFYIAAVLDRTVRRIPLMATAPGGVEIETASGVRRLPDARREDVPALVRELVSAGEEIYGVRVVSGTLEDAYLAAVVGRDG